MRDPHFGNRDYFTGEPIRGREEWTTWDFALATALQVIQDHTDSNGILVWEMNSDRVDIGADKKIDRFQAAVQMKTDAKNYKPSKGESFVPNVQLRGGEWPTYSEYIKKMTPDGTIEK